MILRKIILATATLILSFLLIALAATFIGGVFGLLWDALAKALGYKGSATDALKDLGDPNILFQWLSATVSWLWNTLIKPIVDWFTKMVKGG